MSYTTLYKVPAVGRFQVVAEFPNAFLSAMVIWEFMCNKWLPFSISRVLTDPDKATQLWDLSVDPRVPLKERVVLWSTFEKSICRKEHFEEMSVSLEDVGILIGKPNHLASQATAIRQLQTDNNTIAVAWSQTSVADNYWRVPDDEGEWVMYDISKDSGHVFIFDKLAE